jgi:uncharacterized membrane protein required for colicin V production
MDLSKLQPVDLLVFFALFGMFILGFVQGIVRRVIGIASMLFSLVLAAQLRDPLGNYLSTQWLDQPPEYSRMVAFGAVFVAGVVASTIGIQWFYRAMPLLPRYPVLEEVVGGLLGLFQGVIVLSAIFIVLDPFYTLGKAPTGNELGLLRSAWEILDKSVTAQVMREHVLPNVMAVFGFLFPSDVRAVFHR